MGKQVNVKVKDFAKALKAAGFSLSKGGKGSHVKWVKEGSKPVIYPSHDKCVPFYVVKQAKALGVKV